MKTIQVPKSTREKYNVIFSDDGERVLAVWTKKQGIQAILLHDSVYEIKGKTYKLYPNGFSDAAFAVAKAKNGGSLYASVNIKHLVVNEATFLAIICAGFVPENLLEHAQEEDENTEIRYSYFEPKEKENSYSPALLLPHHSRRDPKRYAESSSCFAYFDAFGTYDYPVAQPVQGETLSSKTPIIASLVDANCILKALNRAETGTDWVRKAKELILPATVEGRIYEYLRYSDPVKKVLDWLCDKNLIDPEGLRDASYRHFGLDPNDPSDVIKMAFKEPGNACDAFSIMLDAVNMHTD